jgi:hypothetical protein
MLPPSLAGGSIRRLKERRHLGAIQARYGRDSILLERDVPDCGRPRNVLWPVLGDEASQGMDGPESLVTRADAAAPFDFHVLKELTYGLG